ncbi:Speckle-type POZ protein [Orchesella cincta]|uniref:Speckle-type POZ protein n=1 Tax=Orchesella cincta TaxID=48709 RepID=A0A1D2NB47_ORCCI|nr:Speckle-type POZ protein [Orchesella cincta]
MDGRHGAGNSAKRLCLPKDSQTADSTVVTKFVDEESFSFKWVLKDYTASRNRDVIRSPDFYGGPTTNHRWRLKINPKQRIENQEWMSIKLSLIQFGDSMRNTLGPYFRSEAESKVSARFTLSFLDANGSPISEKTSSIVDFDEMSIFGWNEFISSRELASLTGSLLVDDGLTVLCKIWTSSLKHKVNNVEKGPSEIDKAMERHAHRGEDLGRLFKESIWTDAVIQTSNKAFKVHKLILSAFSPVFAAALNENADSTITISQFPDDIVEAMLEHVYTGVTSLMNEMAPELLQIANKYELSGLKKDAEYFTADRLIINNAVDIMVFARVNNSQYLKSRAMKFIIANKEEVMKTNAFEEAVKDPANVGLIVELFKQT